MQLPVDQLIRTAELYPGAVIVTDVSGRIVLANDRTTVLFGYSQHELIGTNIDMLVRAEGLVGRRKCGDEFPIEVSFTPTSDDSSIFIINRIPEQLRHSQKLEAIGCLADSIVHDFNNLIAVISAQSELLMELEDVEAIRRETEVILNTADRAAALTRQLLAFSREQTMEPRVFNLNELLVNMDQMLGRLLNENVEFSTVLSPDLGHILADPSQIEQVVMNLVVNARDAMPEGGALTVETSNVELDGYDGRENLDAGRYVVLTVTDTGVGMSADVRSRLFEPFFTTKPAGQGTGLGLSTVYAVVKRVRGHVWLFSEPNRGTTFKVYFPRVDGTVERVTTERKNGFASSKAAVILLVEDEEHLRHSLRKLLEGVGYVVLAASHGNEALRIFEENHRHIDLVLTDVGLPYFRGPELVERLKTRQPQIKAVFISGFGKDSLRPHETARVAGCFVQKPFRKDVLLRKLEQALDGHCRGGL